MSNKTTPVEKYIPPDEDDKKPTEESAEESNPFAVFYRTSDQPKSLVVTGEDNAILVLPYIHMVSLHIKGTEVVWCFGSFVLEIALSDTLSKVVGDFVQAVAAMQVDRVAWTPDSQVRGYELVPTPQGLDKRQVL